MKSNLVLALLASAAQAEQDNYLFHHDAPALAQSMPAAPIAREHNIDYHVPSHEVARAQAPIAHAQAPLTHAYAPATHSPAPTAHDTYQL